VHAFEFINGLGERVVGRYRIVPIQPPEFFSEDAAHKLAPDYLKDELPLRFAQGKVKLKLILQIADKDDLVHDPSVIWPENRRQVELGTLVLNRVADQGPLIEKKLAYSPLNLSEGIAPSTDPILLFRPAAYALSEERRHKNAESR